MMLDTVDEKKKGVHTRYLILLIIFIVTAVNYADRAPPLTTPIVQRCLLLVPKWQKSCS